METRDIAKVLKLTAQLMELHDENTFKVKSISNAAFKLDKTAVNLQGLSLDDLEKIEGIGKGLAHKIHEIQTTGQLRELNSMMSKTPLGVIEMLNVKGIGPKKVALLWKELGLESVGELLYACIENRLIELKGFGRKTQDQIKQFIEFSQANAGKFLYASVEDTAMRLVDHLRDKCGTPLVSLTGAMRRKCEIIEKVEVLVAGPKRTCLDDFSNPIGVPVEVIFCDETAFYSRLFETTASKVHLKQYTVDLEASYSSEEEIYAKAGLQFIAPELREDAFPMGLAEQGQIPALIAMTDLKGVLHNHSTYSDGIHTLREMALYCRELGYEYLGICDHSQSAFYANGLKADRVMEQHREIDLLNRELAPFRIFKGIESDILFDGSLDYPPEILATFDFVVASIHSNLKMDKEKATARLVRAIENPYTTILGHMTGRLLLSREAYPLDVIKIIDACAANKVVIELNANPYRLDMDWRWIPYCLEKDVMISINPDAHEKEGYHDMHYGICVARKGMLDKSACFNAQSREEIEKYLNSRKFNNN